MYGLIIFLQNAKEMDEWMTVIQNSISNALNSQPNPKSKSDTNSQEERLADLKYLQEMPENKFCADCRAESKIFPFAK